MFKVCTGPLTAVTSPFLLPFCSQMPERDCRNTFALAAAHNNCTLLMSTPNSIYSSILLNENNITKYIFMSIQTQFQTVKST